MTCAITCSAAPHYSLALDGTCGCEWQMPPLAACDGGATKLVFDTQRAPSDAPRWPVFETGVGAWYAIADTTGLDVREMTTLDPALRVKVRGERRPYYGHMRSGSLFATHKVADTTVAPVEIYSGGEWATVHL